MRAESLLYDLHLESINPEAAMIDNAPSLLLRDLPIEYANGFKWLGERLGWGSVVARPWWHCLRGGDTRGEAMRVKWGNIGGIGSLPPG